MELLVVDEPIRQRIVSGGSAAALQRAAVTGGMTPIFLDGLARIEAGLTTLEELLSTVDVPDGAPDGGTVLW